MRAKGTVPRSYSIGIRAALWACFISLAACSVQGTGTTGNGGGTAVGGTVIPDTQSPSIPASLGATPASASHIDLVWSAATDNVAVTGYRVYRGGTQIANVATTSYADMGLAASTTYSYRVAAQDAAGNVSAQSNAVSATTTVGGGATDTTAPSITITGPTSAASYTSSSATLTSLAGTASDNVGVTQATWSNSLGGSGTASGATSWSVGSITLQNGANTITVTARDAAGNTGTDSIVVTYGSTANTTYYLSPAGSNTANGTSISTPWRTFAHAFSRMVGGDELILLDGTYSAANGTGFISYVGTNSAQPPSGISLSQMTYIHALNPGQVRISGSLFLGRSFRKDSYIKIQGITFDGAGGDGAGSLYNTGYVTIKDCGFHGAFAVGTNDHHQFNDNNLVEDVWVWASGARVVAINYRSHNNVWRRVVVRGDGCGTTACSGSGNPNVGITVYESNNISFQNVIVVDRILASTDSGYADFAVAQHDSDASGACVGCYTFGNNEWLGTISINAPDVGYYMEPDHYTAALVLPPSIPTITLRNVIAWNSNSLGFNLRRNIPNGRFENLVASARAGAEGGITGIAVQTDFSAYTPVSITDTVHNALVVGARSGGVYTFTGTGIAANANTPSNTTVSNAAVFGMGTAYALNGGACTACATNIDPLGGTTPSLRYLTRIEAGSPLKGAGIGGADIGANILYRYGVEGSRYGESSYNALTDTALWPWPNEARIKQDMCANTTRGFCSTGTRRDGVNPVTLTTYIWEQLGNPIPSGIYP
jgi:chitodextrinase